MVCRVVLPAFSDECHPSSHGAGSFKYLQDGILMSLVIATYQLLYTIAEGKAMLFLCFSSIYITVRI